MAENVAAFSTRGSPACVDKMLKVRQRVPVNARVEGQHLVVPSAMPPDTP